MSEPPSHNQNQDGGRSLGGGSSEPLPASWARGSDKPKVGRIGAWSGNPEPASRPHTTDDDDDDYDENDENDPDKRESWFAGGERSGISIENPDRRRAVPGGDMVRDLLRRAAEAGPAIPAVSSDPPRSQAFFGGGHVLGSDDVPSSFIPDPDAPVPEEEETAIRRLTFWRDGFTVEEGPLMRYDDPNNAQVLSEIHAGRAPPSILNVRAGQPVELRVAKRTEEEYVPPRSASLFAGVGHRLGAPVPEVVSSGTSMPGSFPSSSSSASTSRAQSVNKEKESLNTRFEVDQNLPTTSVQIRLADGTRMVCRMNLTHTVQDLRNFINASRPENLTRPYTIGTTFPNRTLDDNSVTIENAGLVNSVIVQRWV